MKQYLLLFILLFVVMAGNAQVVYVDAAATGSADGTSWDNAYTNLAMAIDSADTGSALWIAAGRYVTPDTSSFIIDRELSLYGGFAGGETSLDAANPSANETILSGDVLGNDPVGSYDSTLMVDNNRVLAIIDTALTSQYTVVLDGLTIRDGVIATNFPGSVPPLPFSGGGIYSEARLAVSRVTFTANRADYGAASALYFGSASGSTFDRITSQGNYAEGRAVHFSNSVDSVSYMNSSFTAGEGAIANSGMIYAVFSHGLTVNTCTFEDIEVEGSVGAAVRTFAVLGQRILNSTFTNLYSEFGGGALYFTNADQFEGDREVDAGECLIDNCTFTNVTSADRGGVIYLDRISSTINNSDFTDGEGTLGGAVYFQSGGTDTLEYLHRITNSTFDNNSSSIVGGAICYLITNADFEIIGNTFRNNSDNGEFSGGAIYHQGTAGLDRSFVLNDNEFDGNSSIGGVAGAVRLREVNSTVRNNRFSNTSANFGTLVVQGGGNTFDIVNNRFEDNGTVANIPMARGGGIVALLDGGDAPSELNIDSCTFQSNVVTNDDFISGGSAIYISGDRDVLPIARISNSSFLGNAANGEADGTIEVVDGVDVQIFDCDFSSNSTAGSGGAINVTRDVNRDSTGLPLRPLSYDVTREPRLLVERSLFINNSAANQGGAINLNAASITAKNSIFIGNALSAETGGSGGAIIINGSSVIGAELDNYLINNTFFNNSDGGRPAKDTIPGSTGNAVAIFQPGNTDADTNSVRLTIQNNAFFQSGIDEESLGLEFNTGDASDPVGFGELTVRSLGGNFFSSNLTPQLPIAAVSGEDVVNVTVDVEDIFTDPFGDFTDFPEVDLLFADGNNPLIDGGTTGPLVPELDFFKAERDDMPDIGAIEYGADRPVAVAEPIAQSGLSLEFYPNPTVDEVHIINNDAAVTNFTVLVSDMQGRYVGGRQFGAARNTLNVSALPKGAYNLSLLINGKVYSKQIVKQ